MLRGTITYKRSPKMLLKQFRPILKHQLRATGLHWWKKMLPGHFEPGAGRKYKYKPRTKAHIRRKLRMYGHRQPLVFTGRSKRQALREARLRGTSKRIRVVLRVPNYFYAYSKMFKGKEFGTFRMGKKVDKAAEMTSITLGETKELAIYLHDGMTLEMENLRGKEVVKIG